MKLGVPGKMDEFTKVQAVELVIFTSILWAG